MEDKKHYESLTSFLKYTLGITGTLITVIISVGIYFSYKSTADIKQDIKDNLKETKEEIRNSLLESKDNISALNSLSTKTMSDIKEQAKSTIATVRDEAVNEALTSSRREVEKAFNENNIQAIIDETAKKEIESRVYDMVSISMDKIPDFILSVDKIRAGDKRSFLYIDSIAKNTQDKVYKAIAMKIIKEKTRDYENSYPDFKNLNSIMIQIAIMNGYPPAMLDENQNADTTENGCKELFRSAKNDLKESDNLNTLALDIKILRFLTNTHIPMFDFDAAEKVQYREGIPHPK